MVQLFLGNAGAFCCLAVLVAGLGVAGCSVPELDVVEAGSDGGGHQEAASEAGPSGSQRSGSAAGGGASQAAEPKETAKVDVTMRRGFELRDLSNASISYVLVKADVGAVSAALAERVSGAVREDAYGASSDYQSLRMLVYRFAGHSWSVFACGIGQSEKWGPELSKELGTDVLVFSNEDTSGWSSLNLFRGGESVESMQWGLDYSEEFGSSPNYSEWDVQAKVSTDSDGITFTDQFLFRSRLRDATEAELQKGEAFVDELFKQHDAYLPDLDLMVWLGESGTISTPLGKDAVERVDAIVAR